MAYGFGIRVQGLGFEIRGFGFRVCGSSLGFRPEVGDFRLLADF